uniref:Grh/CP2 DB domain-containing protein n=1 Tax=Ciona savignyi TaxID=51511 RepID=H2ZM16_CIOSA
PPINPLYTSEDEAWRSYLENPLTAASTAMMSIHGDEDSAAALGILYDYYKVPREKRILAYQPSNKEKQNFTSSTFVREDISGISPLSTTSINPQSENVNSGNQIRILTFLQTCVLHQVNGLGEYLNIGRTQDIKQLTPDSTYSEAKESPPQITQVGQTKFFKKKFKIYNDYTSKYIKQHSKVSTYPVSPKNYNNCTTPLTTTPTGSQPFGSPSKYFEYAMEAPKSLKQKDGEPTMSYINKGQFYCISLRECSGRPWRYQNSRVTSVVQIVFGDGKPEEEQLSHWKYWHARQHTAKQRIIDIADYKESCMISDIDEFAHNAISFSWDVNDVAKIFVSCNCLSTDFSAQKGIKGLPLLLQIDTYIDNRRGVAPAHRGMCQLKVFCDKGAERKIRDEERKAIRKRQRSAQAPLRSPSITPPPAAGAPGGTPGKRLDVVYFRTVFDYITPSVYFVPEVYRRILNNWYRKFRVHYRVTDDISPSFILLKSELTLQIKLPMPKLSNNDDRVLLYVRKENDEVYDGIMLRESTVKGLKQAIEEKYGIPVQNISKVLKKSRKGILVNIDDNIVRHYSNEDTFIIDVETETLGNDVTHKITLSIV